MKMNMLEMGFELLASEVVSVWKDFETETKVVVGREFYETLKLKSPYNIWINQTALLGRKEGTAYWTYKEGRMKERLFTLDTAIDLARNCKTEESDLVALWLEEIKKGNFGPWTSEMLFDLLKEPQEEQVQNLIPVHETKETDKEKLETNNNQVIALNFENQNVRVVLIDGNPWFVGKDVAEILEYTNYRKALRDHIDSKDKITLNEVLKQSEKDQERNVPDTNRIEKQSLIDGRSIIINESGLYSLVLGSKLPTAQRFKHWVTSEVLPSLRKNGGYIVGQERMTEDEYIFNAMKMMKRRIETYEETIQRQSEKIEQDKPKVAFADSIEEAKGSVSMGFFAKEINKRIMPMGRSRLFAWMRDNGYLITQEGEDYNTPTQRCINAEWFEVVPHWITKDNGEKFLKKTVRVTGKGQRYFIQKFLELKKQEEEERAAQKELENLLF